MTDSEQVSWEEGEKHPGEGSEIVLKPYAYKQSESLLWDDGVPIEEWSCELVVYSKVKPLRGGAEAKASPNRAILVVCTRPETRWSNHVQGEGCRNTSGGPNSLMLQNYEMRCG